MSKKNLVIGLCILTVFMGFIRDYLFDNINWVYKTLTEGRMLQARKEFHFLMEWSPDSILTLKWILTILFYGLFLLLTVVTINLAFKNRRYNLITIGVFLVLFGISGFLYSIAYFMDSMRDLYGTIRTIMGMAQSFIPLMILGVIFKFIPESERQ